ncbi:helix-hairpin-helix motif protein [Leptolyngbya sp. Heron Island J]|uniref:phospholipase D-like domain-containing protein n=1 Tax=Leptolyngbya sp. Heron Island J TaxID=1385935 RepID=UPI0003B96244|nr:phospholipase D-like domain-containing protein [Leptolyngbya sp. Heron Island J]ESA36280.1 helix-hairpin-helix motif protein [Leptolyngbya sp. Heron Island J]
MLKRSQVVYLSLSTVVLAGLGLGYLGWKSREELQPLPQDPHVQVFFNQSETSRYQDPYRRMRRSGDNLEQVLLDAINQATMSVDVAVQELNLPQVANALIEQARAGITVRVILEHQYSDPWSQRDRNWIRQQDDYSRGKYENLWAFGDIDGNGHVSLDEAAQRDAILMLRQADIPIVDDTDDGTKGSGLMHHKFIVVDQRRVITGTANFTLSGMHGDWLIPESLGNANALLDIQSPELAAAYTHEFDLMWGDGPGIQPNSLFGSPKPARPPKIIALPNSQITVQFSPHRADAPREQTTNGVIAQTLSQASQSVDLALFVFTDQGIVDTLAARPNLRLRTLIDRSFIYRYHSEALDMLGMALPDHRCNYETDNRPWRTALKTVGYPVLADGDKLHHKFALLDDRTVIIGSHNWSKAANHKNDENLLIIENRTVAQHFKQEFERLYHRSELGRTDALVMQIKKMREKCGGRA